MCNLNEYDSLEQWVTTHLSKEDYETIKEHGCAGGVDGLIYHDETRALYDVFESEILELLDDIGYQDDISSGYGLKEISSIVTDRVWAAVELLCVRDDEDC